MRKVLRSNNTYRNFLKEEFKIIFDPVVSDPTEDSVSATLVPYIERVGSDGVKRVTPVDSMNSLEVIMSIDEIEFNRKALNLPSELAMYDLIRTVELETAKSIIESSGLSEINGVSLLASDFETVSIDLGV